MRIIKDCTLLILVAAGATTLIIRHLHAISYDAGWWYYQGGLDLAFDCVAVSPLLLLGWMTEHFVQRSGQAVIFLMIWADATDGSDAF